jgi:hypothetical protein
MSDKFWEEGITLLSLQALQLVLWDYQETQAGNAECNDSIVRVISTTVNSTYAKRQEYYRPATSISCYVLLLSL